MNEESGREKKKELSEGEKAREQDSPVSAKRRGVVRSVNERVERHAKINISWKERKG